MSATSEGRRFPELGTAQRRRDRYNLPQPPNACCLKTLHHLQNSLLHRRHCVRRLQPLVAMTVLIPCSRTASRQLISSTSRLLTRQAIPSVTLRVRSIHTTVFIRPNRSTHTVPRALSIRSTRSYATEGAAKPRGRPKAHTGREPAKRKPVAKKQPTAADAPAKKNAGRPKKATKAKSKPKPKPKPKKTTLSVTAQKKQASQAQKALREKALLHPPKKLPETAWTVLFVENAPKKGSGGNVASSAKGASEQYKNLSPEEHEVCHAFAANDVY